MAYLLPLLLLLVLFAVHPSLYLPFHTPKNFILMLFGPILLFTLLFSRFRRNSSVPISLSIMEVFLITRLGWAVVTNPEVVMHPSQMAFWMLIPLTLMPIVIRNIAQEHPAEFAKKLLQALYLIGFVQALIGLYQWNEAEEYPSVMIKTPIIGTVGAANGYGLLMTVSFLATLFQMRQVKKTFWRVILALMGFVILTALAKNGSRGAVFALFCGLGSIFLLQFHSRSTQNQSLSECPSIGPRLKNALTSVGIIGLLAIVASTLLWGLYQIDKESATGRFIAWNVSLPMVLDQPLLGIGYNRFSVEYLNYQALYFADPRHLHIAYKAANLKQAHNEFLQAFCETGVVGGILFLLIWLMAIYFFYRKTMTEEPSKFFPSENRVALAILIAVLVHSMLDTPLHVVPIAVISYSILGLIPVDLRYVYTEVLKPKILLILVGLLAVSYAVFVSAKTIRQWPGYKEWDRGYEQVEKKHPHRAIPLYRSALDLLPDHGELQFHLGSALVLTGFFSEGISYLEKSLRGFNDRNIHLSLAYANLRLGNYERAARCAKAALSMFPDHLAPHLILGEIYFAKGDTAESKQSLQKCIRRETKIWSADVEQIRVDAKQLWFRFYGNRDNSSDP